MVLSDEVSVSLFLICGLEASVFTTQKPKWLHHVWIRPVFLVYLFVYSAGLSNFWAARGLMPFRQGGGVHPDTVTTGCPVPSCMDSLAPLTSACTVWDAQHPFLQLYILSSSSPLQYTGTPPPRQPHPPPTCSMGSPSPLFAVCPTAIGGVTVRDGRSSSQSGSHRP